MQNIAQFKFSNGQEVVCEVMEWPEESNEKDIIVRNAMTIVMGETPDGERIYMFRPWAHYLESPEEYIIINSLHVVSTNRPSTHLMEEYEYAVSEMHLHSRERDKAMKEEREEQYKRLQESMTRVLEETLEEDRSAKILKFPAPDDTIH